MKLNFVKFLTFVILSASLGLAEAQVGSESAWQKVTEENGITVYRQEVPNSPIVAFRGIGLIDAPISKVVSILMDTSRKTEWVSSCKKAKDIKIISDYERTEYNYTGTPFVMKDRDFVFHALATLNKEKNQIIVSIKSTTDPSVPPTDDAIRGEVMDSQYILDIKDGGKKTLLQVDIFADPKGSVPKWIVNMFQRRWPIQTIKGIRDQAARSDVKDHEGVKKFFGL
jgi:hypothetical protein